MDDELDIKHALNRHVTRHEPPFALTVERLLTTGRTQGRWRMGMTYGAASLATIVTVTGALTVFGPGGGQFASGDPCTLPLAIGWSPRPSSDVVNPSPTGWPGATPTADVSLPGSPGVTPTADPDPSGSPWGPWPTASGGPRPTSTAMTLPPSPEAMAATCYLARELRALFPDARYAAAYEKPPMFVHEMRPDGYLALGTIVDRDASTYLILNITRQREESPRAETGLTERDGKVYQSSRDGLLQTTVYTGHTTIYLSSSGPLLTLEQIERLASAPELDLFRP